MGDEWHDNGPQDLVMVSLCIHNAIDKMQLSSLSVAYACPYHNLTATMGHTTSVICPGQLKPGFIREEHTSTACQWPSKVCYVCYESVTMPNCSQVKTPMRMKSTQMSLPETVSYSLCRNSLFAQTHSFISCPGRWLVSDDPAGEETGCGGPGLVWLHVVYGCKADNIKFSGNSSGGNFCSQHANCTLPQNLRHLWHCVV